MNPEWLYWQVPSASNPWELAKPSLVYMWMLPERTESTSHNFLLPDIYSMRLLLYRHLLLWLPKPFPCDEVLDCWVLGATPSEWAKPVWFQLFCTCACVSVFFSLPHCPIQVSRTKLYRIWWSSDLLNENWWSERWPQDPNFFSVNKNSIRIFLIS